LVALIVLKRSRSASQTALIEKAQAVGIHRNLRRMSWATAFTPQRGLALQKRMLRFSFTPGFSRVIRSGRIMENRLNGFSHLTWRSSPG
jgi:hypothetical protein